MAIKKIKISNFKSFKDSEIELGKFNVLIGANASGKSNFIQIFKFLRDITDYGLDNAISMQGGVEYLRNISIGSAENFSIEAVSDRKFGRAVRTTARIGELIGIKVYEEIYNFAIKFKERGQSFGVAEDKLMLKSEFVKLERREKKLVEKNLGQGEITISNVRGKVKLDLNPPEGVPIGKEDIIPLFLMREKLPPKTLLLWMPLPFLSPWQDIFSDTATYDFDPKLSKSAVPIAGKAELEENGSNLTLVLKNIIEDRKREREFSNLIKDLLPFVDDLKVERFVEKSLLFKLRETYSKNQYLPAFSISDGTINIAALIIALYFEEKPLRIFEEPERNIHPYLISRVVEMMKEASEKKQIILTTHNPEIVKYAGLENILLISRDKEGFSTVSRPTEKEAVKTFLENEIGIEELYAQNLLELKYEL